MPPVLRAFFLLALAGPLRAGRIEAPVPGEIAPAGRPGAIGFNAADLDWALQNDADFVNQFVDRDAAQR